MATVDEPVSDEDEGELDGASEAVRLRAPKDPPAPLGLSYQPSISTMSSSVFV